MHTDYDPDDNFARAFDPEADIDDEAATEALLWQLLLLINPGDEDEALQQFTTIRERLTDGVGEDVGELLLEAIDWRAGFRVAEDDREGLVDALDQLAARYDVQVDWGTDDPTDPEFLVDTDAAALIGSAYDRLREHQYTLWTWEAAGGIHAGWVGHRRDDEAVRTVAGLLGIPVRPGSA